MSQGPNLLTTLLESPDPLTTVLFSATILALLILTVGVCPQRPPPLTMLLQCHAEHRAVAVAEHHISAERGVADLLSHCLSVLDC